MYHNFIIDDQDWIKLFLEYKADTKYLWNNPNNGYGSRVFWRTRINKQKQVVFHGQPLGKDWFYRYPKDIAKWLNKPNWKSYSGHSICRFGSTVYADAGASILQLKKYGGWKSNKVVEEYYANSSSNKIATAKTISDSINSMDHNHNRNHNHNHNYNQSHNHNNNLNKDNDNNDSDMDNNNNLNMGNNNNDSDLDNNSNDMDNDNNNMDKENVHGRKRKCSFGDNQNNKRHKSISHVFNECTFNNCTFWCDEMK